MAWPSSTKASTANVDAGSDSPSSARADIKQNIDNVNSIIDTFDIASPSNGDILTYNSTSGAWEPGAASSGGSYTSGYFRAYKLNPSVANTYYDMTLTTDFDPSSVVNLSGNTISLAAGTYCIIIDALTIDLNTGGTIRMYNDTDATIHYDFVITTQEISGNAEVKNFTLAGTKTFSFDWEANSSTNSIQARIKIMKS